MTIQDDCRKWADEMYRAAEMLAAAGMDVEVVNGNRAIADTLTKAAEALDRLERRAKRAEDYIKECLDPKTGEDR